MNTKPPSTDAPRDHDPHAAIRDFYNGTYYASGHGAGKPNWHLARVARRLGKLEGCAVLDIACGTGDWLALLAARGARVHGIDLSARAIDLARARLPGADLREGVAEQLPFEDARFDLVTCLGSLEHFLDQPKALSEMRRVARPGARVLILVPNAGFLTRRVGLSRGTWQADVRETVRSLDEWNRMLHDAGLEPRARWRDLHVLDGRWIRSGRPITWPLRLLQALVLPLWPMAWQYQVYFDCRVPVYAEAAEARIGGCGARNER
jgi:SAM-dependent methyltransferase